MRAFVFTDASLARHAGRFVWLSIDIEKPANASFRTKFTIEGVPSFFIIEPKKSTVALRWLGGATVEQLTKILDDGERAVRGSAGGPAALLAEADRVYGEGDNAEAARLYSAALKAAPVDWVARPRATETLLFALQGNGEYDKCVEAARVATSEFRDTPASLNAAALGLDCALSLPAGEPGREEAILEREHEAQAVLANERVVVAPDDRSGLYITLLEARHEMGDERGARQVAQDWSEFLDRSAASAPNPEARVVYDSHRLSAYLELGRPECALPMLEASQRDFPSDYNPPARLAVALKALGRYEEALAASNRALEHAYGPRRLTILRTRVEILEAKGDTDAAIAVLAEALSYAEALPAGQRSERTIASLREKLEKARAQAADPARTPGG